MTAYNGEYLVGKAFGRLKATVAAREQQQFKADQFKARWAKRSLRHMLHLWKEDYHLFLKRHNRNKRLVATMIKKKFLSLWLKAQQNRLTKVVKQQRTDMIYNNHI